MNLRRRLALLVVSVSFAGAATSVSGQDHGAIASDHPLATRAGASILAQGGNAVDAAIATSFALSVVRPMSCGIGGGGFMLVYDPSQPLESRASALNYRETAPSRMHKAFFAELDDPEASQSTGAAVGVPGTVAGLWAAHQEFGSLDWSALLRPAIDIAENGYAVDDAYMSVARDTIAWFEQNPERKETHENLWKRWLKRGDVQVGDVIRNPEQARALSLIAERGPEAFYEGEIATAIEAAVLASGGVLQRDDLRNYEPEWVAPLEGEFRGRTVYTMPPPSSGGIATLQALGAIERFEAIQAIDFESLTHNTAAYIHVLAETLKHAFADRAAFLADPAFADVPVDALLSDETLQSMAERVDEQQTLRGEPYGMMGSTAVVPTDGGTSHISVVDYTGMAVACTETINLFFGSKIAVPEFGFCLNNEIDDFTTRPGAVNAFGLSQSENNLPEPGKRPLSSMSPTIVVGADDQVEVVTGARGGPRIITATIQSILNVLVFRMPAQDAAGVARIHHQWSPPFLGLEPALTPQSEVDVNADPESMMRMFQSVSDVRALHKALRDRGHLIGEIDSAGVVEMVVRTADGLHPATDPRGGGAGAIVMQDGSITMIDGGK